MLDFGFARIVRNLELANRGAAEDGDVAGVRMNVGEVTERTILLGAVMSRIVRCYRVLDPRIVIEWLPEKKWLTDAWGQPPVSSPRNACGARRQ